jgi:hypothetical protein
MLCQFGLRPDTVYAPGASIRPGIFGLIAVIGLLVWPFTEASAQHDVPLTIAEAEDLALASEPGQQALHARAAALEEQAVVAGALPDPMLRLGLNNYPIESGGFTTEGMTNAGAVYRQAFPRGDTRSLSNLKFTRLAEAQAREADARGDDVLAATRIAWLDLYYWTKAHEMVTESLRRSRNHHAIPVCRRAPQSAGRAPGRTGAEPAGRSPDRYRTATAARPRTARPVDRRRCGKARRGQAAAVG